MGALHMIDHSYGQPVKKLDVQPRILSGLYCLGVRRPLLLDGLP